MTVSLTNAEVKLLGNGSTTVWPLGFELKYDTGIVVHSWDALGNKTLLTLNVDYTVSDLDNEAGATLTLLGSPLPSGEYLYVVRQSNLTQQVTGGAEHELNALQIEAQLDQMAMQIQELKAELARALKMATAQPDEFVPVANGVFGTDAQGRAKILTDYSSTLTVVSGAIVWEGPTVADFLADTDLGYSGSANVQVAVGDLIRAGGFRYIVEDGAAATYDLESAGGVRVSSLEAVTAAFENFSDFTTKALSFGYGLFENATISIPSTTIASVNELSLVGSAKSKLSKLSGSPNLLTFTSPQYLSMGDISFEGNYGSLAESGHGLVLRDAKDTLLFNLRFTGFGGLTADNGGAGILAYPNDGSSPLDRNTYMAISATGSGSGKDFGMVLASARYNIVLGSMAQEMTNWGLEYKNNSVHNVMAASVGYSCRYSFGTGYGGALFAEHNVFGLLASQDSDIGFLWSHARNNLLVGLNVDVEDQPNTFGDNNAYGLHIEQNSDENVALGVVTSGAAMDYPIRIRGVRNVAVIADYSDAGKSLTLDSTAQGNYVELQHLGGKTVDVRSVITDAPNLWTGTTANVVDSPTTRQYYGSQSGAFTYGLDGLANTYSWGTFPDFRFEGKDGESVLGLGTKTGKQAGLVVVTSAAATEARFVYQLDASTPYWRMDVDETQIMRWDTTGMAPVTDASINLGKDTFRFNNAYFVNFKFQPPTALGYSLVNGEVTITRPSNTQLRFHVKGSDGTIRTATLTLA